MVEVTNASSGILKLYNSFINSMPDYLSNFFNLMILVLVVFVYVIFIWKLYTFISKKNFLKLNLRGDTPNNSKLVDSALYFLEYIIISPFVIFFWFGIFFLFLTFLTEGIPLETLLLISAIIIAVTRLASFYKEDLARDVAKLLPFTLLAIAITTTNFFDVGRVFNQLSQIPQSLTHIITYLVFIFLLEAILRFFEFIFSLFGFEITDDEEEKVEEKTQEG